MDLINSTNITSPVETDQCSLTAEEIQHSYNLSLHIASVFVLLVVSFLGATTSVLSARIKSLHINPIIINTGKFFGSGVVLATGFVHILPDAMEALTDPCLPDSWNVYGAYGGLFAMLAALAMQLIEFLAHQRYRSIMLKDSRLAAHIDGKEAIKSEIVGDKSSEAINKEHALHAIEQSTCVIHMDGETEIPKKKKQVNKKTDEETNIEQSNGKTEEQIVETKRKPRKKKPANVESIEPVNHTIEQSDEVQQTSVITEKPRKKKHTHKRSDKSVHIEDAVHHVELPEKSEHNHCVAVAVPHIEPQITSLDHCEESGHSHGIAFQDHGQENKISTYLLEFGIALHSVLIGLTLGTTTESFVPLFIALCFHQFFEAIALGAQIANLKTTSIKSAIYMVIFFSLTTPVGIAIGIGIHSGTYNPKSVSSLLVTGILDSLSAGVLIYVALVNLISAEMGANAHAFYALSTRLKFLYFIALYLGVAAMAVIGRWA